MARESDIFSGNDLFGAGSGQGTDEAQPEIYNALNGDAVLELPDASYVRDGDIARDGQDLIIEGPDGGTVIIEGYFAADPAPILKSPDGIALTPDLVQSFVHGAGGVQYAQNGTMSDVSPIGEISEVSGDAFVVRGDGVREPVVLGTEIYQGDVIETSAEGAVNIVFVDESNFAVSENARLAINEYIYDPASDSGKSNFSVLRGVFVYVSGLIGRDDPDDVEIDTPMGSIGIRDNGGWKCNRRGRRRS